MLTQSPWTPTNCDILFLKCAVIMNSNYRLKNEHGQRLRRCACGLKSTLKLKR